MLISSRAVCRAARRSLDRHRTTWIGRVAIVALAIVAAGVHAALAAAPTASTSPAARKDAIKSIPFDKLDADAKTKISAVLNNTSIYRRLPTQVTQCDPDLYLFLVQHPVVIVDIWRVMGVSKVALESAGDGVFHANDGAGTTGTVVYCYQSHDTHVIYAEGAYDGPVLEKPIRAKCVLLLKSGYMQETDGRYYVTSRLDSFITFENAGVELLAKTLQPLVNKSADYNFIETSAFVGNVSRTAESNHRGVAKMAGRLSKVDEDVRDRFAELAVAVATKSAARQASASKSAKSAAGARRTASRQPTNKK